MKNFFFITQDSPFYWVRSCSLETHLASNSDVKVQTIFRSNIIQEDSLIVFNRFSTSSFFRWIAEKCISLKIPFVFDLDDIFWNLLENSRDQAKNDTAYQQQLDWFINNAGFVTTTNDILKQKLLARYKDKEILVIPNALVPNTPLKGGLVIANTDNFKMGESASSWFSEMIKKLWFEGVPVHIIGENQGLTRNCLDFYGTYSSRMDYNSYLRMLSSGGYRWGLIPVEDGEYADCKSPIKAIEFLNSGMKVLASDITPYRDFKQTYPDLQMELIPNRREAWEKACFSLLESFPGQELLQNKVNHHMQNDLVRTQLKGWAVAYERFMELIEPGQMAASYAALQRAIIQRQALQRCANSARSLVSIFSRR